MMKLSGIAITLYTHIPEVHSSILQDMLMAIMTEVFLQPFQANTGILPSNRPHILS
jgi:hypothetical protein